MRLFDYKQLENLKWDAEVVSLLTQIHEHKGRQELYLRRQPQTLDRLVELAKIQSIEDSNKIEGIVTTTSRLKELMADKTTPRNRDEEEILGYRDVLETIHDSFDYIPVTPGLILQLHRDLYKYSGKQIGGRFKNTQNAIIERRADGSSVEKFKPLPPYETEPAIVAICQGLTQALDDGQVDSLLLISIFIHDFLCIHPFNDGNGRMSRLLTTLLLYRQGYLVGKYISLERKIEKTKLAYYAALDAAGQGWHDNSHEVSYFVKYLLGIILSAYRDFEERLDIVADKQPTLERVRRAVDSKLGKFTKKDLLELVPDISRATVENALRSLVQEGYVQQHGQGRATFYTRVSR